MVIKLLSLNYDNFPIACKIMMLNTVVQCSTIYIKEVSFKDTQAQYGEKVALVSPNRDVGSLRFYQFIFNMGSAIS